MNILLVIYVSMGLGQFLSDFVTARSFIKREFDMYPFKVVLGIIFMIVGDCLIWPVLLAFKEERDIK